MFTCMFVAFKNSLSMDVPSKRKDATAAGKESEEASDSPNTSSSSYHRKLFERLDEISTQPMKNIDSAFETKAVTHLYPVIFSVRNTMLLLVQFYTHILFCAGFYSTVEEEFFQQRWTNRSAGVS
jgi:hypothetical protein